MKVIEAIDERIIDLSLDAKNKEEAIMKLTNKLNEAGYVRDIQGFIKDIYERETLGATGIGNYIAIPHGKSDSVNRVGISIGRLKEEIEWETLDGKGVKLIFLFAVSNDHEYARNHMRLLAEIATKLGNDEVVEKLLDMNCIEQLKEIFSS
ncbi:MAG: fructose PTS transporter subunit IIA [Breznakia sp.]